MTAAALATLTRPVLRSRPGGPRHSYTPDELDLIRREYDQTWQSAERLALQLGVSKAAICAVASRLGLTKQHGMYRKDSWTAAEDAVLTEHAGKRSAIWMHDHFLRHRSKSAIEVRMKRLHLRRGARDGWYCLSDACHVLGLTAKFLRARIASGDLRAEPWNELQPGQDGGALWRIDRKELRRWTLEHLPELTGRNVDLVALCDLLMGVRT